jgi:hypothetical protein
MLPQLEDKVITVTADHLPSRAFNVKFKVPKYSDKLEATSRHPGQDSSIGYNVVDLMFALCLEEVERVEWSPSGELRVIDVDKVKQRPMDVMDRTSGFPYPDMQTLIALFTPMFTIGDDEDLARVRAIADQFLEQPGEERFTIQAQQLPTRSVSLTFLKPRNSNIMEFRRSYGALSEPAFTFDEYMAARCLLSINDHVFTQEERSNPINFLKPLYQVDVSFYMTVLGRVSLITEEARTAKFSVGKSLLASAMGNDSSNNGISKSTNTVAELINSSQTTRGKRQSTTSDNSTAELLTESVTHLS